MSVSKRRETPPMAGKYEERHSPTKVRDEAERAARATERAATAERMVPVRSCIVSDLGSIR